MYYGHRKGNKKGKIFFTDNKKFILYKHLIDKQTK